MTACFSSTQRRRRRCRFFSFLAPCEVSSRANPCNSVIGCQRQRKATRKKGERLTPPLPLFDLCRVAFLLHCAALTFEWHGCCDSFFLSSAFLMSSQVFFFIVTGEGLKKHWCYFFRHAFLFSVRPFPNCNDACMSEHLQPSDLGLTVNSWGKFRMPACVCACAFLCRAGGSSIVCRASCRSQSGFFTLAACGCPPASLSPVLADAAAALWEGLCWASVVACWQASCRSRELCDCLGKGFMACSSAVRRAGTLLSSCRRCKGTATLEAKNASIVLRAVSCRVAA